MFPRAEWLSLRGDGGTSERIFRRDPGAARAPGDRRRRPHHGVDGGARAVPPPGGHRPREPVAAPAAPGDVRAAGLVVRGVAGRARRRSAPPGRRGGAHRRATRATSRPRCAPRSCTSGSTSSASTSASRTRASGSSSCTTSTSRSAAARAARSTAPTPTRSPSSATGWCRWPRSRCTRPTRRSPTSSTRCATLGFKAVLLAGYVQRPVAAVADRDPELAQYAQWIDMYGIDSAYDYDPVWAKCRDLGVGVSFHSGSIGWGSRASISNYMYNHLGHLAEGQHALAQVAVHGRRDPPLPGPAVRVPRGRRGVGASRSTPTSSVTGRSATGTRSTTSIPNGVDQELLSELLAQYGSAASTNSSTRPAARAAERPEDLDEWAACEIEDERRHPRPVRAELLLRLRGRRPADRERVQHQAQSRSARASGRCSAPTSRTGTSPT